MLSPFEIISLLLVGATWGCSNSLLRKGSTESIQTKNNNIAATKNVQPIEQSNWITFLKDQLFKFRNISVWLPYIINQSGSILFYITLSQTDLSLAVPVCNALALVFSIITSWFILNEPVDRPIPTVIGAIFVMIGVAICVQVSQK
jgi:multidrug transporter EmrE-like cation transporter